MIEYIYIPLILIIYFRTWRYNKLIDDPVPRNGYLYEGPRKVHPSFYDQRRGWIAMITNVGVFMASCGYIHLIWGWKAALLFALMPTNVGSVSWNTGNYYQSTVLLLLSSTHFLQMPLESTHLSVVAFSVLMASVMYAAALNSTVNALAYIFIAPFISPYGWFMVIPLMFFLKGKRFTQGMRLRKERHKNLHIHPKFECKNLVNVPKILAFYIYMHLWPSRLSFFYSWGKGRNYFSAINMFFCSLLCLEWWWFGLQVDPLMIWWYFASLIIFCKINGNMGQFVTVERYSVLANVAFAVILSKILVNPILFTIICSLYFSKSYIHTRRYRTNETLFAYAMHSQPNCPENFNNLGNYYMDKGQLSNAVRPLQVAEILTDGDKFRIYASLMQCYKTTRNYGKALEYANKALGSNCPEDRHDEILGFRNDLYNKILTIKKHNKLLRKKGII